MPLYMSPYPMSVDFIEFWQSVGSSEMPGCENVPCGDHGTCSTDLTNASGYSCACSDGYGGPNCNEASTVV